MPLDINAVRTAYAAASRNRAWFDDFRQAVGYYMQDPDEFCRIVGISGAVRKQFVRSAQGVRAR